MKRQVLTYGIVLGGIALMAGCTELKNDKLPTQAEISVHGDGFADTTSTNFHAVYVREHQYNYTSCTQCHGADYAGGTTGVSCLSCHSKSGGVENCTTCHGSVNPAPPKDLSGNTSSSFRGVGAHQKHLLGGTLGVKVKCSQCHAVPASVSSVGHIDSTAHAEVRLDTSSTLFGHTAVYDPAANSCANTYCHGNFTNGNAQTMTWTDTNDAAACGTCHGDVTQATAEAKAVPKTSSRGGTHPTLNGATCSTCHRSVIDASMNFIDLSKHINGKIDF